MNRRQGAECERHRLGPVVTVQRAGLDLLPLGIPRVEPVAFGAADAVPLHFDQRDIDLHTGAGVPSGDRDDIVVFSPSF